jgi:hypothetical protein
MAMTPTVGEGEGCSLGAPVAFACERKKFRQRNMEKLVNEVEMDHLCV